MQRLRTRSIHSRAAAHQAPAAQNATHARRDIRHQLRIARLKQASDLRDKQGLQVLTDAMGFAYSVASDDSVTVSAVAGNAISDCKQFGLQQSTGSCDMPITVAYDSSANNGNCNPQDRGAVGGVKPKTLHKGKAKTKTRVGTQQLTPDPNTQVRVLTCGNPPIAPNATQADYQAALACISASAAGTCDDMSSWSTEKKILVGFLIAGLTVTTAMLCYCCHSRSQQGETRRLRDGMAAQASYASSVSAPSDASKPSAG